ncbi:transposase IS116/IS110/IS902 (plasmid) [Nitrobacter hamburgensis X14]|uniref:Transposase IS116/IS110/IS902 n=1 Tax=Nitrobacter hamburgensis (strain DSM 10229 / NCIMB 13809 / X14) TaxID=323097 RepID=Q1QFT3_NITHX|nr:transposase IS116/IS110/IS902 [Nitrobacter hamburgensis X14]ABE63720.1 transposase IS116/IS110/IS902 [Nitrobacter hamburgensis X14]ABE64774.1 transposase IS116/IS110/IS902 [Nitrobacter hamburgensis X14]ABE64792.1 transposase IS116/IS110/IS902 [Nitrobacter hamburgensis X14]ABE64897.1 transposase IS116/IS110/IS902 [Nitrobacter hamburgensis X14]
MRRVIGIDTHRTFGEVVIWEDGRLRHMGRVDMTRTALEGFGKTLLTTDEVVIEATGNCMAVSRVLSPFVKRVVIANPLQVKAIAHAHVKTDKIDAGTLANLYAAGYLPEIWTPDAVTERMRRLVARRYQVVRHRTRIKNEVHSILYAHLIPQCPHADLFGRLGRAWLIRQQVPDDERAAIERHIRELDRLGEDLGVLDREIAEGALSDTAIERLLTITGVNLTVAAGLVAAIGDIGRFSNPQKLVSYFGLNPRVRQSGLGAAHHGRISKVGRSHARAMLVEAAWAAAKTPGPLHAFFVRVRARRGHQVAAVAVARKLTVLCWHMLTKETNYLWARPSLVAHKMRGMELQAGRPQKKGNTRGPAYAYNVKKLRNQEMRVAEQAQKGYEHFVEAWRPRPPKKARGRLNPARLE